MPTFPAALVPIARLRPFAISMLAVGCGLGACGDPEAEMAAAMEGDGVTWPYCEPEGQVACQCETGAQGLATCKPGGASYTVCDCGAQTFADTMADTQAQQLPGEPPQPVDDPASTGQVDPLPDTMMPLDPAEPLPSSGCGAATWPDPGTYEIQSSAKMREYILYVPNSYDPDRPYTLLFIFHGLGVDPNLIANSWNYNGFKGQAGENAIFVVPRGQQTNGGIGWANAGESVQLVRDLLAHVRGSLCVDDARIFSTGSSYGGIMSNRVGCALGDEFRAIAPVMGNGPSEYFSETCTGEVAAWLTHGRNDTTVSYASGERSRDYWATANGCSDMTTPFSPDECVEYVGCVPGLPVVWCPTGNGHQDPPYVSSAAWTFFNRF